MAEEKAVVNLKQKEKIQKSRDTMTEEERADRAAVAIRLSSGRRRGRRPDGEEEEEEDRKQQEAEGEEGRPAGGLVPEENPRRSQAT
jgi:hypothetical protein